MDGHGRRPGTYFQGWTPSSHFLGDCQKISSEISKSHGTGCQILMLKYAPNSISAEAPPWTPVGVGELTALP